jgi:hypothetical protein
MRPAFLIPSYYRIHFGGIKHYFAEHFPVNGLCLMPFYRECLFLLYIPLYKYDAGNQNPLS